MICPFFDCFPGILVELKGLITKIRNHEEEEKFKQLNTDFHNTLPFKSKRPIRSMSDVTSYLNVIQVGMVALLENCFEKINFP